MNRIQLVLIGTLIGAASTAVMAADPASESTRRERMDQAYEDYRNPQPGPAARAESSIKRGAHKTGEAIERGAKKVGHAVGKGVRKTGEVIGRGGEKLEEKSAP
ncbi:MAG: hypothetical protein ABI781_16175 [Burkholderiales bacterium]